MKTEQRTYLHNAAEAILSLFYPRRCPVCQDIAVPRGALICPDCRKRVSFIEEPTCRRCGKEVLYSDMEYCFDCTRFPRSFDGGVSLMHYDAVGRASMQGFKYHGRQEYAAWYAEALLERYGDWIRTRGADALVPVPVHASRLRRRGYNQAEVLARELSRRTGIPVWRDVLVRTRRTAAQKNLGGGERQKNLLAAMKAGALPKDAPGVFLVDDIYTTGSTAEACTRALKRAGAAHVWLITVCIGRN